MILVVEDDSDVRLSISEVLEDSGYGVVSVSNGKDALDLMRRTPQKPELVLLDLMMPVMDGVAFRAAQSADPVLKDIPVVVMTAHPKGEETATHLEAAAFIQKPIALDRLIEVVSRYCRV